MKNLILIFLLLPILKVQSQELKVTYNNKILMDSTMLENVSGNEKNEIITDSEGEDYELVVRNGISLYEPVALKEDKTIQNSNTHTTINYNYYETIYNDYHKGERTSSIKYSGETFLINEKLVPIDWQIIQETKKIDSYDVKRAEAVVDGHNIIVWFTEEIPVSAGPSNYIGLPGLILQAQFGKRLITATKIEPLDKAISISAPTKGQEFSREEYSQLLNEANNVKEGTTKSGNKTTTVTRN
jgi:GLPGLI family protein